MLSPAARNWYLLCWDVERDDWRTFRVDRIEAVEHLRARFAPRPLTAEQVEEFVQVATSWSRQAVEAEVVMDLPIETMRERFGQWAQGAEPAGEGRTRWPIGGSDFREVMYAMTWVPDGVEYTTNLGEPARSELAAALRRMQLALESTGVHSCAATRMITLPVFCPVSTYS